MGKLSSSIILIFTLALAFENASTKTQLDYQTDFSNLLKWEETQVSGTSSWFLEKIWTKFEMQLENIFKTVGKQSFFASRHLPHMKSAMALRDIFMAQESLEDTLKLAGALRDHPQLNKKLWLQALILAKYNRPDMKFLRFPTSLVELMPDDFIPREIFSMTINPEWEPNADICLVLDDRFATDNGDENALWYFREDIMANAHHFLWHIFFAILGERVDRRGESFSFMHHEFISRYATERMTNGLPPISAVPLDYVTQMETYWSHLSDQNSGTNYTDRAPNTALTDIQYFLAAEGVWLNTSISDQIILQDLLYANIRAGHLIAENGSAIPLDGFTGIDLLGETIESSVWSVNPERYNLPLGDMNGIHNNGHGLLSSVMTPFHPNASFGINIIPGVMARPSTSMRDPIFYRWHTLVENLMLEHKNLLEPYTPHASDFPLSWPAVNVTDVKVISVGEGAAFPPNELKTFWGFKEFKFTRGLDHANISKPVLICAKHLDHIEFNYEINVENFQNIPETKATVRIYMARREDVNLNRFSMEEQRELFFTLDQFSVTLTPGINKIVRNSKNSTLTIPFESWVDLEDGDIAVDNCGCGWPQHLLLPKGSASGPGTPFDVFVMITEGAEFNQQDEDENESNEYCRTAPIWCGIRNQKYPSRFPMGYPFDRRPYAVDGNVVANLDEYVQGIPNMNTVQVQIQHLENEKVRNQED